MVKNIDKIYRYFKKLNNILGSHNNNSIKFDKNIYIYILFLLLFLSSYTKLVILICKSIFYDITK
jgi:hypothetical protein